MVCTLIYLGLTLLVMLPALAFPPYPFAYPCAATGTGADGENLPWHEAPGPRRAPESARTPADGSDPTPRCLNAGTRPS